MSYLRTRVVNPMRRGGEQPFQTCPLCHNLFTSLGMTRHWNSCEKQVDMNHAQKKEWTRRRDRVIKAMAELSKMIAR